MITEIREIYKCEHCRKIYQIERFCELHELKCIKNPINFMACIDCDHAVKKTMNYTKWIPCLINGEQESEAIIKAFWCNKKGHWIYPSTRVLYPIIRDDIKDEIENKPMPSECEFASYLMPNNGFTKMLKNMI